jgi:hypothetical protein
MCGCAKTRGVTVQRIVSAYDALALIPIDRAAFSYQTEDLKSLRRAVRNRFPLDTFFRRDLPSSLRDTLWFKFVSLGEKRSFSWRHRRIKSMEDCRVKLLCLRAPRGWRVEDQVGRYFDFVPCLVLPFLSAASLANRSSFNRAVFARTA